MIGMSKVLAIISGVVWTGMAAGALLVQSYQRAPQEMPRTFYGLEIREVGPEREDKVVKTEAEWRKQLTDAQYKILRRKGTEAAFCGGLLDNKEAGTYHCIGCDLPLFKSDAKFESGTGWPSFFQPFDQKNVWLKNDYSPMMGLRIEVLCSRCDGHLGHVFDDGPRAATGLRYCINSEILKFKPADDQTR